MFRTGSRIHPRSDLSVRVKDRGARLMVERLGAMRKASGRVVDVGIIGNEASALHSDSTLTVAAVAAFHELGLGVPRRSFIRDTIDQNRVDITKTMRLLNERVARGSLTTDQALGQLGAMLVGMIQLRMASGIAPELAPATIAAKGSTTPLIDTGQLRSSVTSKVRNASEG